MENSNKILIIPPFYPPHTGGLETHADEFNKHLSRKGFNITVFTPQIPKEAQQEETIHNNIKIIRYPAFEIIHNYPLPNFFNPIFWKLFKKINSQKFNLIISRTRFFSTSFFAGLYAKCRKITWIHIEHGSDFAHFTTKFKTKLGILYDKTFGKIILKKADYVIANSQASSKFVKKLSNREVDKFIYRGIDIDKIISIKENREIREECKDKVIITYVGRLIDGKGIKDLITALSLLNKNTKIICLIIGEGSQKKSLIQQTKKLNLENKIKFLGKKSHEETISILKTSDLFITPSYTEGLPTTVIEAALTNNAIIATDVGGTNEVITNKKSGILIEPKNIQLLKEKIELLISDQNLRKNYSKNAFKEVNKKFNWENSIQKYISFFNNIKK